MKISIFQNLSRCIKSTTAIAAVVVPAAMTFSGVAHAYECAPLQVSGFKIHGAKKVIQGNTPVGVEFVVETMVRNTNRQIPVSYRRLTSASAYIEKKHAPSGERKSETLGSTNFTSHLPPGHIEKLISKKIRVMRDPRNLSELTAVLRGSVYNAQCPQGKQRSKSEFKYDFLPVLTGGQPRRVSGRITGYAEGVTRPRPGSGAPRPRAGSGAPRARN